MQEETIQNDGPEDPTGRFLKRVRSVVGDGHAFRFVSEPRRRTYLTILHCLLRRRQAHQVEVYHDELRDDVARTLRDLADYNYDSVEFRSDIEQLSRWGNLSERVEPTRIRSLSDRGRSKLLLRLEPETVAFLDFLEARTDPIPLGAQDRAANLLADVHGHLKEAVTSLDRSRRLLDEPHERLQAKPGQESALEDLMLRASYLIHEADGKADQAAAELVGFGDMLSRFTTEPFRIADLAGLGDWLERYLDRYLTVLEVKRRAIRLALSRLESPTLMPLLVEASRIERDRLSKSPGTFARTLRIRPIHDVTSSLRVFFDVHTGLSEQCRRLNRSTRRAIRRIQRHVEAVRLRNVRTEMIRGRIRELFELDHGRAGDGKACRFIEEVIAAVATSGDARAGTPESRSAPPRPIRRYESSRSAFRGQSLQAKRDAPGQTKTLETMRLALLSRFMEERVLKGRSQARLSQASLTDIADGSRLVQAVTTYFLRGGRARKHLGYCLEPQPEEARTVIDAPDHTLDLPDTLVRRKP